MSSGPGALPVFVAWSAAPGAAASLTEGPTLAPSAASSAQFRLVGGVALGVRRLTDVRERAALDLLGPDDNALEDLGAAPDAIHDPEMHAHVIAALKLRHPPQLLALEAFIDEGHRR